MRVTPFVISDLPETPSQTAGPYVHIGLIPKQAGFEIFENNFSGDIASERGMWIFGILAFKLGLSLARSKKVVAGRERFESPAAAS